MGGRRCRRCIGCEIYSLEAQISSLNSRIDTLEGLVDPTLVNSYEARINSLESSVASITTDLIQTGVDVTAISSGLDSLRSDINSSLLSLTSSVNSLETQITSISPRTDALETQSAAIQAAIDLLSLPTQTMSMISLSNQGAEIGVVPFDTVRLDNTNGNILYNPITSRFTIFEPGSYLLFLGVVYNAGTLTHSDIIFGLFIGNNPVIMISDPITTLAVNRLSIGEIIRIGDDATEVWIEGISFPRVNLANTIVQSSIAFIKLT